MPATPPRLPLNALCHTRAWDDPEWRAYGRLLALPQHEGWYHRKAFEWIQCVYGLDRLGALDAPGTKVLGVAAGHECTLYHLANRSALTVATDLYGGGFSESIAGEANPDFLADPQKYAPFPYHERNLAALPADALRLPFATGAFDVVYSLSSIEHFGGHHLAAEGIREMARVVRPGGIACIATEYVMEGGQHPEYFTIGDLRHWVIGASPDLRLVEPLDLTPPPQEFFDDPVPLPDDPLHMPHVVLALGEWRFTSIVLFFRKRGRAEQLLDAARARAARVRRTLATKGRG